ncbi:DNA-3-methyladenine glycosylase [Mesorhizobium sp. BAC0120]|uniref:DNA-3-methyladenine glycosylase family protein n=1 Tax=Mesorhizobium sp. BAC0120 TaxID=3090670 RepID=UPI00298BDFD9|nr:DNA-3-methyladenine glycosylase [Mesorhizobium sp. BAC0120]MDW6026670.1 DNA-3-methyladenine glycosylase [Mesorhizobium sp. BAC0120]
MRRIDTLDDVAVGLDELCRIDPRLAAIRRHAGEVPLRRSAPGFASLASIIVSQQVSTASARAIFGRFEKLVHPLTAAGVLAAGDEIFREAGLSRPKVKTLRAIAQAVTDGLDLDHLETLDAADAIARLTAIAGIGQWTAEVYLLFAIGHPDIFPARDVALQTAVGHALGMEARPGEKALIRIAESWAPWRGVASRLFWAYYRSIKGREAVPVT